MRAFLGLVAVLWGLVAHAGVIQGRVVAVQDGDTITVLDAENRQHRIRLSGIDAPEKGQPFGQRSKQSLSSLVFGQEVTVDTSKVDRYGREIGRVVVHGVDANLEQLKLGMAWHYKAYAKEQPLPERSTYADAEEQATQGRVGLWSDDAPTPPWEYRRTTRHLQGVY